MARTKKPKSRTLTIFLLKSTDDDSAMLRGFDQLVAYPVNTAELSGTLYVQRSTSNPPEWVSFLGEVCGKPIDEVTNSSAAAVFISTRGLRKVAITFGFGRHLLTPGCWGPGWVGAQRWPRGRRASAPALGCGRSFFRRIGRAVICRRSWPIPRGARTSTRPATRGACRSRSAASCVVTSRMPAATSTATLRAAPTSGAGALPGLGRRSIRGAFGLRGR